MTLPGELFNQLAISGRRALRRPGRFALSLLVITSVLASAATVWSLLQFLVIRPLPYPEGARLVSLYGVRDKDRNDPAAANWDRRAMPWQAWEELATSRTFDKVAAWAPVQMLVGDPAISRATGWYASSTLLNLLMSGPIIGRTFTADDDMAPVSSAVLLSHETWRTRYGGSPDAIGTSVTFVGQANERQIRTIVGVLPPGIRLRASQPEYVFPIGPRGPAGGGLAASVYVVARLADGQTVQAAEAALSSVLQNWPRAELNGRAVSLREDIMGSAAPPIWLLVVTALALFVVAAGTAAACSLSDAAAQQHETVVRMALGATASRLRAQIVAERLLHLFIAGPAGCLLAFWVLRGIVVHAPQEVASAVSIGGSLLRSGLAGAVAMALLIVLVPIVAMSHRSRREALVPGRTKFHTGSERSLENIAIIQVALAMVLVASASLLVATFVRLTSRPVGFDPSNLALISLRVSEFPPVGQVAGRPGMFATWVHTEGLAAAVEAVPGVMAAAGVNASPFGGVWSTTRITSPANPDLGELTVQIQIITSKYFDLMGVPLVRGRRFDDRDRQRDPEQAEINAIASLEFSRLLGGEAVGRRVKSSVTGKIYEIVGVVGNVRQRSMADQDIPTLYLLSPTYTSIHDVVYRYAAGQRSLLPTVASAIRTYDPSIVILTSAIMSDLVSQATAPERFRAVLASGFASVTLFLAVLGAYAVASKLVTSRRREMQIRIALGAAASDILASTMYRAARVIGCSSVLGLAAAAASAQLLRGFLFGASVDVRQLILAIFIVAVVTGVVFVGRILLATRRTQFSELRE